MNESQKDDLPSLFARACQLAPTERALFVNHICQRNPELRAPLERLLAAHGASESLFPTSPDPHEGVARLMQVEAATRGSRVIASMDQWQGMPRAAPKGPLFRFRLIRLLAGFVGQVQ